VTRSKQRSNSPEDPDSRDGNEMADPEVVWVPSKRKRTRSFLLLSPECYAYNGMSSDLSFVPYITLELQMMLALFLCAHNLCRAKRARALLEDEPRCPKVIRATFRSLMTPDASFSLNPKSPRKISVVPGQNHNERTETS